MSEAITATKSQEEIESLVLGVTGLVYQMVNKRYKNDHGAYTYDDMVQTAKLATVKAAHRFLAEKGFQFTTLAGIHIKAALSNLHRRAAPVTASQGSYEQMSPAERIKHVWGSSIYLSAPVHATEASSTVADTLLDSTPGIDAEVAAEVERRVLLSLVNDLPPAERDVVVRAYGIGCPEESLADIAISRNVTRQRVHQLLVKGQERLKKGCKKAKVYPTF